VVVVAAVSFSSFFSNGEGGDDEQQGWRQGLQGQPVYVVYLWRWA